MPRQKTYAKRKAEIRAKAEAQAAQDDLNSAGENPLILKASKEFTDQLVQGLVHGFDTAREAEADSADEPLDENETEFDRLGAGAYAAQWGCDPSSDRPPREPGDGTYFYNYGSQSVDHDSKWLQEFTLAIQRTMKEVEDRQKDPAIPANFKRSQEEYDKDTFCLQQLFDYVQNQVADALEEEADEDLK